MYYLYSTKENNRMLYYQNSNHCGGSLKKFYSVGGIALSIQTLIHFVIKKKISDYKETRDLKFQTKNSDSVGLKKLTEGFEPGTLGLRQTMLHS